MLTIDAYDLHSMRIRSCSRGSGQKFSYYIAVPANYMKRPRALPIQRYPSGPPTNPARFCSPSLPVQPVQLEQVEQQIMEKKPIGYYHLAFCFELEIFQQNLSLRLAL